jgi:hypothetical protein
MKHERDFDASYFHDPQSPGGELLPLHHVADGDDVDGFEGETRSGSDSVSLLSS